MARPVIGIVFLLHVLMTNYYFIFQEQRALRKKKKASENNTKKARQAYGKEATDITADVTGTSISHLASCQKEAN